MSKTPHFALKTPDVVKYRPSQNGIIHYSGTSYHYSPNHSIGAFLCLE